MQISQEKLRQILQKNKKTFNKHKSEPCYILATGPSSGKYDLSFLKDKTTIALNYFCNHPQLNKIKPKYYVIAHPSTFNETEDSNGFYILDKLEQLKGKTELFFPLKYAAHTLEIERYQEFSPNYFLYEHNVPLNTQINFSQGIPGFGQNIVNVALLLAFHLGCNPIYLLGVDNGGMVVERTRTHFYKDYDYDFDADGENVYTEEVLKNALSVQITQANALKDYAERFGIKIFNLSSSATFKTYPYFSFEKSLV
jgi:hypothetical protein